MRHVPVAAFKDKVSEFITAAENGDEIVITRHGRPTARLCAVVDHAANEARARLALEALAQLRTDASARGVTTTIDEMIDWKNEGRR